MTSKPELMSPAGDWIMLRSVIAAGADAVYFGADRFSMRAKATNFTVQELPEVVEVCRAASVATYLTINTIIKQEELEDTKEVILAAKDAGVDMIICWDPAVITLCREVGMPFCVSTQASIANAAAAKFYEMLGAKRIVLARECTLDEIKVIREQTPLEIEVFIHGAMCIAVSGRCFLSHEIYNRSANRGECFQSCRREYEVRDTGTGRELIIGEDYVLSAKDLNTLDFLDLLIDTGINSFKIEGRKRSPEYAAKTTSVYRRAIDAHMAGKLDAGLKAALQEELHEVYNRGFSHGFYFGKPGEKDFSKVDGSAAKSKKEYLGKVLDYYKKPKVAYILVESGQFSAGDTLMIMGKTTGLVEVAPTIIMEEEKQLAAAMKGQSVTFKCDTLVREGDKVYLVRNHN